jgi:hypothetical protein
LAGLVVRELVQAVAVGIEGTFPNALANLVLMSLVLHGRSVHVAVVHAVEHRVAVVHIGALLSLEGLFALL